MQIIRYNIVSSELNQIADFIWHLTSDTIIDKGKLLPVINTDLIINASTPIYYATLDGIASIAPSIHIRNMKLESQYISQDPPIDVWGISLLPYGIYSIIEDMRNIRESIIDFESYCCDTFFQSFKLTSREKEKAILIENEMSSRIRRSISEIDKKIMDDFLANIFDCKIGDYCEHSNIGIKRLERLFKKYTGRTPKQIQQIARFQQAGNELIYNPENASLVDIAYSHNYADQMHLSKAFKKYSGVTPFKFLNQSDSIKKKLDEQK